MDTVEHLESLQCREESKLNECNISGDQITVTNFMTTTPNNVKDKGASGDSNLNLDTLTAEQLSSKLNKVNTTNREQLNAAAQQIIEDLNSKRRQDTQLLADFRKALEVEVNRICDVVEQQIFRLYDKNSDQIQTKVQELFAYLDRICKIEAELQEFKQALQILYQDMNTH